MKKECIFIFVLFITFHLKGQNNNQLHEIVETSLHLYIEHIQDFINKGIVVQEQSDALYVCVDGLPSHYPLDSMKNVLFFSLNNHEGLPNSFKQKLKKGINAIFVEVELKDNQLFIAVSSRSVKLVNKKNISISIGDWGHYFYEYFCDKKEWKLKETKYGGI